MKHTITCILLNFIFLSLSQSQIAEVTSWTQPQTPQTPLMPLEQATLMTGYHEVTNRIWLIGGYPSTTTADEKWYFDITSNTFSDEGVIPITGLDNLNSQSSTQIGNSIYFGHDDALMKFDMNTEITSTISTYTVTGITAPCLANNGRYIFVIGGQENAEDARDPSQTFQVYDTAGDSWFVGDALTDKRQRFACNTSPDLTSLYVFGGSCWIFNEEEVYSIEKIDISDIAAVESSAVRWETVSGSNMEANYYFHRSVVDNVNNLIYIIGGRDKVRDGISDKRVQIFDPATDTISTSSYQMTTGRSSPAVVYANGRIYVFGGADTGIGRVNTFEYSNILTLTPTKSPTKVPSEVPTDFPTLIPSFTPTESPTTYAPTKSPTRGSTQGPSFNPTSFPTRYPTLSPQFESVENVGEASQETTSFNGNSDINTGKNIQQNNVFANNIIMFVIAAAVVLLSSMGCCVTVTIIFYVRSKNKKQETDEIELGIREGIDTCDTGASQMELGEGPPAEKTTDLVRVSSMSADDHEEYMEWKTSGSNVQPITSYMNSMPIHEMNVESDQSDNDMYDAPPVTDGNNTTLQNDTDDDENDDQNKTTGDK